MVLQVSPQPKLGFLCLKLKLIRYYRTKSVVKIRAQTRLHKAFLRMCATKCACICLRLVSVHMCTDLYKKNLVVESYLMNLSFKFHKDSTKKQKRAFFVFWNPPTHVLCITSNILIIQQGYLQGGQGYILIHRSIWNPPTHVSCIMSNYIRYEIM